MMKYDKNKFKVIKTNGKATDNIQQKDNKHNINSKLKLLKTDNDITTDVQSDSKKHQIRFVERKSRVHNNINHKVYEENDAPKLEVIKNDNVLSTKDNDNTKSPDLELIKTDVDLEEDNDSEKLVEVFNEDGTAVELETRISENQYLIFSDCGLGPAFRCSTSVETAAYEIAKKIEGKTSVKKGTTFSTNLDLSNDKSDPFFIVTDHFLDSDSDEIKDIKINSWFKLYPNTIYK